MIQFPIKNWLTGEIKFTTEIEADEETPVSIKLGLAAKWGVKNVKDMPFADLMGANLEGTNLMGANLEYANLMGANLEYANLEGTNLEDANLTFANLKNANLEGTNLPFADLMGANLEGTNLEGANLEYANLMGANLKNANLEGTNLEDANLTFAKSDMFAKLLRTPLEADNLLKAVKEGRINGSVYEGECACFAGTIAKNRRIKVHELAFEVSANSPVERFFLGIKKGDTPENHPLSKIAADWVQEFIVLRDAIRGSGAQPQTMGE